MLQPDPGSFRDPLSRVYVDEHAAWRGLSADGLADYEALAASRTFQQAVERGQIVDTDLVPRGEAPIGEGWAAVLRHERLSMISYPYEWSFSMLRDAARLQLDLARQAIDEGLLSKDASPYNIQFVGAAPVFIDVGSFERLRVGEPWPGYRQFCELFLNPLYLQAYAGIPFQSLLRSNVRGIPPAVTATAIGPRRRLRPDVLTHVRLHARAERRYADADATRDLKAEMRRAGFGPKIIAAQMDNLRRAVERTEWRLAASTWSAYSERSHYTDRDLEAKADFVSRATSELAARTVLDLGANDGHFSRVALDAGADLAIAVDGDHLVVDHLYRALKASGEGRILPLVVDLADPSPGTGWRSRERAPFVARMRPDLTLCLAVIHHLALTNTVPFAEIVELLRDFQAPLVVEMPHRDDVMAARLLGRKRTGLFDHYDLPQWEAALSARFEILERATLPSGTRTLYRCALR